MYDVLYRHKKNELTFYGITSTSTSIPNFIYVIENVKKHKNRPNEITKLQTERQLLKKKTEEIRRLNFGIATGIDNKTHTRVIKLVCFKLETFVQISDQKNHEIAENETDPLWFFYCVVSENGRIFHIQISEGISKIDYGVRSFCSHYVIHTK